MNNGSVDRALKSESSEVVSTPRAYSPSGHNSRTVVSSGMTVKVEPVQCLFFGRKFAQLLGRKGELICQVTQRPAGNLEKRVSMVTSMDR